MAVTEDLHIEQAESSRALSSFHFRQDDADEILQACLARNSYNEDKCKPAIFALYSCCEAFYAERGKDATTASCPKASSLAVKMDGLKKRDA